MQRRPSILDHRFATLLHIGWLVATAMPANLQATEQETIAGLSAEILKADDVFLTDTELNARWRNPQREFSIMASTATLQMDYVPSQGDLLGQFEELHDTRFTGQFTWRESLDRPWRWIVSAGGYEGFTDYRSMWLNEYYRQLFSVMPGYHTADVSGQNVSVGGTYEYLPASGMINWSVGWMVDNVAPAYDKIIGGPLVEGLNRCETWRFGLGSEHVLTPRMRFKQDATAYQTTARPWRFAYKAESIWAFTDTWVLRSGLEGSSEAEFQSGAASLLFEHDWESRWFAGIFVRAYSDNGQIVDPLLVAGSSPPLDSLMAQATLRYAGPNLTMRLAVGPYFTRYAALEPGTRRFATLYQDRNWLYSQASLSWSF